MPLLAVPEVYKEGKDGGHNVYDGHKKSQVYTLSNLVCLTTDQQWQQGLGHGCRLVYTIPGFASHSHHFQGMFTTQEGKELKVSRIFFFFTRTIGITSNVHLYLQTSTHLYIPFLI